MSRKIIAVCSSWEDEENLTLVLNQLIEASEGYLPLCVAFDRSSIESRGEESIRELLSAFDIPDLAGILLCGEMIRSDAITGQLIRLAHAKKLPVFMLERQYEGCINMSFAYADGFEAVVRHMLEDHGCRDIVMVAGIRDNPYSEERIGICRRLLEASGGALPPERVLYGNFWDTPTVRALDRYFADGGQMPEAFVCANDAMAIAVCAYLAEMGVQVPAQVKVSGFDGILPGEAYTPAITTARPDFPMMFGRMLERIAAWRPEDSGRTEVWSIPFELKCRQSCGCAQEDVFEATKKIANLKNLHTNNTRQMRALGNFIRSALSGNSLERLIGCIPPLFHLWPDPYYFAAALDEGDRSAAWPIFHGVHGLFSAGDAIHGPYAASPSAAPPSNVRDRLAPWQSFRWRERPVPDLNALRADPSVRLAMVQLLQNEGETLGYLVSGMERFEPREQERFTEQALFLSSALSAAIGNHRLEEANRAILRMAEHDYLTGLYNRRGFLRELEHRLGLPETQGLILTLFSMDMDGLKRINDAYGHHEGDVAIHCLAQAIQPEGISARYGGDEFAFAVLAEASLLPSLEAIRERIESTARRICGPKEYLISASLGGCSCPVKEHPSLDQLLAEADRALYADKLKRKTQHA